MTRAVFIASVGARTGAGHLVRCSSLALALRAHGVSSELLAVGEPTPSLDAWLAAFSGVRATSMAALPHALADAMADADTRMAIVDGAGLCAELGAVGLCAVGGAVLRVTIDDGPPRALDADVVIDPNLFTAASWPSTQRPRVLAGERYALLRPEFVAAREPMADVPLRAERVLITCGASDPAGATELFLRALPREGYRVTVAVGALNPRRSAIEALAAAVDASVVVGATSIVPLARDADLVLSTLGVTAAEVACLGIPNLSLAISDVQLPHLERYAAAGIVEPLGWHGAVTEAQIASRLESLAGSRARRLAMRDAGRNTVDGRGAERVATALSQQSFR